MRIVSFLSVWLIAGVCWAQQGVQVQAPGVTVRSDAKSDHVEHGMRMGEHRIVRTSELVGANVKNNADETVGEINDIVVDPDTGRVKYVALSVGGFLGIADQLFAVPWGAFECRKDGDSHVIILNVDKDQLKQAKGFDKDHWPDMANSQWQTENDRIFTRRQL